MKGVRDIACFEKALTRMPTRWDGKGCVLELKEANYQWRQMEWWAFYFEYKFRQLAAGRVAMPGDRYGRVAFDVKGEINWDLKATAIKSHNHQVILNDRVAMEAAIAEHGFHGEIIALCDVEYNDDDRSFQKWHAALKGGLSDYEKRRIARTSISRYRKTHATLAEALFVIFAENDLESLGVMRQGRNSDGKPRREKFMLDLEAVDDFYYRKMRF